MLSTVDTARGVYNDISDELRRILSERISGFGNTVRYRFKLERENPDPEKRNGKMLFPAQYTLDPGQFRIIDNQEKGKIQTKLIGIVTEVDDKKAPRFKRVKVVERDRGLLTLNLQDPDDIEKAMFLELHPKNENGLFRDKNVVSIFARVDETAYATEQRKERSVRKIATDTAAQMSDAEIVEFADAMMWDSTQDILVLRNMAEDIAENQPIMFNDIVADKKMKFQAAVKRAIDKKIWAYNPDDCQITWVSNGQLIVSLGKGTQDNDYERLAEWLMTNGKRADDAYNKLIAIEGGTAKAK